MTFGPEMSQLLRLHRHTRTFLASFSYSTCVSSSLRRTFEQLPPCNKCQCIRWKCSDGSSASIRNVRSYSSGFPHVKTDSHVAMSKAKWEKKKKKTSKLNNHIHAELLSVLNKRTVQLVLNREENLLHRTLVTNFSFTDFPLLTSPDLSLIQKFRSQMPRSQTPANQLAEGVESLGDAWDKQFSSFHKQMKNVSEQAGDVLSVGQSGDVFGGETSSVNLIVSQPLQKVQTQEVLSSGQSFSQRTVSSAQRHDPPTTNIPPDISQTLLAEFPRTVVHSDTRPTDSKTQTTNALLRDSSVPKLPHSGLLIPDSTKHKPKLSVNVNILKTKQFEKPKLTQKVRSTYVAEPALLEDDVFSDDGHLEEMETGVASKIEGATSLREKPSKTEMRRLQKARSDLEKFQADPAKFNFAFNQELMAYVDACCFSGLEAVAHNFLKIFHHRRSVKVKKKKVNKKQTLTTVKDVPDMRQIQEISIYNRLMHSWAKKSQLERVEDLFSMLRADGLKPNMQSYAAWLECLGRQSSVDAGVGEKILAEMKNEGLDVKDLFNRCVFFRDEQQFILKVLKMVKPEYEPNTPPPPPPPSGPLLNGLQTAVPCDQVVAKNPYADVLSTSDLHRLAQTQLQQEIRGTVTFKSILRKPPPSKKAQDYRKKLDTVREEWKVLLTKAVEKKVRYLARRSKVDYNLTLYPYVKLFEPQEYAQCLMQEIEHLAASSDTFSPNKMYLWKQLSGRIQQKFIMTEKIRNKVPKKVSQLYKDYLDQYNDPDLDLDSHRQLWQGIVAQSQEGPSLDTPQKIWPNHILLALGKLLYDLILFDVKVDANLLKGPQFDKKMVPAFYTIYRNYAYQTYEEIKPHPMLIQLYKGAELTDLTFDTGLLPMLVPPIPWMSTTHGGYLLNSVNLVRLPISAQSISEKSREKETVAPSQLSGVLDSINILGACAWTINKEVLDVIIEIFNSKGDASLDVPPPVSECPAPPKITSSMTPQEKVQVQKQRLHLNQQRAEMYSLWCTELYKLSIANKLRDEVLWFPHNLDFRGRTYPCPPHFNHLGSDITRSVLLFAKGKSLGPKGLDWMKIHLINLTGFKKRCSNRERLAYANEMMPEILDSADSPMTGNKWWQSSDEPWQTLACCIEIAKASRMSDPSHYVCHLPIHQDGSCNGLQHYAALGRDKAGAQSVNLWPYDQPQDVYSDVCELVEKERQKDAAEGVHIAKVFEGFVRRKVIKQTVMTTVYGVTRYGAKAQILRQLKDIPEFPQSQAWAGSRYLTDKTFFCLNEMFATTKDIQDWLTLSAQLIATVCQRPVEWVTPLGLPVIQPYHKPLTTARFGVNSTDWWNHFEKPNAMKQKNAFPPNFIHSLDSTHMMLTALYCMHAGITFVSVHDCYWTHACDVEIMNKICRQQFVALHKQPILEDLSNQLIQTYTPLTDSVEEEDITFKKLRNVLANVPARGDFDLDKVLESTYFFS